MFPAFKNASYSDRLRSLCERMMEQKFYESAAPMRSKQTDNSTGAWPTKDGQHAAKTLLLTSAS